MKKGFTLMEVLAVVLILAVIAAFAVPAIRSVRADMRLRQARAAAIKFGQAILSARANTGRTVISMKDETPFRLAHFTPTDPDDNQAMYPTNGCSVVEATGIPVVRRDGGYSFLVSQLFACGYLDSKDFIGIPYTFSSCIGEKQCLVRIVGAEGSGKYNGNCYQLFSNIQFQDWCD